MKTAYIGLGSNIGDRRKNLSGAIERIESPEIRVRRASSLYDTEPRDVPDQPWFLNQVIEVETSLFPRVLLARLLKIEREMGRKRTLMKGPRTIDLDILLFGEAVVSVGELEIPHPRMADRRFVLEPLAELAPDLRHPVTRQAMRDMLAKVAGQNIRRV